MVPSATDLKFRAQLVVPAQREIFDYWMSCRSNRRMPRREDIHPRGIVRHLGCVRLIEVERPRLRYRIRLAGTYFREIYGCEITNKYIDQIERNDIKALNRLVERRYPSQGVVPTKTHSGDEYIRFWLNLPLSDDNRRVTKILSYDAYLRAAKAMALTSEYMAAIAS